MRRFPRGVLWCLLLLVTACFPSSILAGDPILIPPPKEIYFVDGEGQLVYHAYNLKEGSFFGAPIVLGDFTDGSSTGFFFGLPVEPGVMGWFANTEPSTVGNIYRIEKEYSWNDNRGNFGYLVFP